MRFPLYIISLFTIISFFSLNLIVAAQPEIVADMSIGEESIDEADSDFDDEIPDSDITTKIYRSADYSTESFDMSESGLNPAIDADVIDKDELLRNSKSMIYVFQNNKQSTKLLNKPSNVFLPWILLVAILTIIFIVFQVVNRIKL